jgi:hypothetical protein
MPERKEKRDVEVSGREEGHEEESPEEPEGKARREEVEEGKSLIRR